jgi:hypothetical protein
VGTCLVSVLFTGPLVIRTCVAQDGGRDFFIAGRVVNSQTGEPLRQALVTAIGYPPVPLRTPAEPVPSNREVNRERFRVIRPDAVLTDSSGVFQINGLASASYTIRAAKPGFEPPPDRTPDSRIEVGPSRDGITIRLSPLGTLSGKVVDGDGEPVGNVAIRAFQSSIKDERRQLSLFRSVSTDDLGRYHLWNMAPGSYYILAAGRNGGTASYAGQPASPVSAHEGFVPVYYAGALDRSSATAITLAPGQQVQADLSVKIQPALRIRGVLRNHDPSARITIQVFRAGLSVSAARALVNPMSGRFEIVDLVQGSYLIRASQGERGNGLRAQRQIQLSDTDIDGLTLDMAAGVDVTAVVQAARFEVQGPRVRNPDCEVELHPVDVDDAASAFSGQQGPDGKLVISGVPQGVYRVDIHAYSGYVASAMSGSQDLLRGGLLSLAPGVAPPPIEIALRTDGGTVTGTAPGLSQLWALLAPVAGAAEPLTAIVSNGRFQFTYVPPGDYQAFLLKSLDTVEYRNPEALRAIGTGESVHVTNGGSTEIALKVMSQ